MWGTSVLHTSKACTLFAICSSATSVSSARWTIGMGGLETLRANIEAALGVERDFLARLDSNSALFTRRNGIHAEMTRELCADARRNILTYEALVAELDEMLESRAAVET